MSISFSCACGRRYQVPEDKAGKSAKCPACGATVQVPSPQAQPAGVGNAMPQRPPALPARPGAAPVRPAGAASRPAPPASPRPDYAAICRAALQRSGKVAVTEDQNSRQFKKVLKVFAEKLAADEQPLFVGSSVELLVTDKNVHGAASEEPFPLEKICLVTKSRFNFLKFFTEQGVPKTELFLNGVMILQTSGTPPIAFLAEVLPALAAARRQELGMPHPDLSDVELALIAAASVCSQQPHAETVQRLLEAGMDRGAVEPMVEFMSNEHERKDHLTGVLVLLGGLAMVAVPFGVAMLMTSLGATFVVVLKGLGAVGVFVALSGIYRAITGNRNVAEADIAQLWLDLSHSQP